MGVRTRQDRARERARHMMELLASNERDGFASAAAELLGDGATDRDLFFPLLVEVTDACGEFIRARAPESGPEVAYVMDIAGEDGVQVDIDEVPPVLRALLRALLACLEEHRDDELFQLDLVAKDQRLRGQLDALVHALLLLSSLLGDDRAGGHTPEWLHGIRLGA